MYATDPGTGQFFRVQGDFRSHTQTHGRVVYGSSQPGGTKLSRAASIKRSRWFSRGRSKCDTFLGVVSFTAHPSIFSVYLLPETIEDNSTGREIDLESAFTLPTREAPLPISQGYRGDDVRRDQVTQARYD